MLISYLAYYLILKMEAACSPKILVDLQNFKELHSVIFQKVEHFITTAVRTSVPISIIWRPDYFYVMGVFSSERYTEF
jgi:hypothetical protein